MYGVSVAQGSPGQYEHERSRLDLDTPPQSPRDSTWGNFDGSGWATTWDTPPTSPEIRAAIAAALLVARGNQTAPQATSTTEEEDWNVSTFFENMDYDPQFILRCVIIKTIIHIYVMYASMLMLLRALPNSRRPT